MAMEYLRVAYEYLQMIGGLCAFCKYCRRVLVDGSVDCEKHGLVRGALKCKDYEPAGREEFYQAVESLRHGATDYEQSPNQ
jgi:hypothetical protein